MKLVSNTCKPNNSTDFEYIERHGDTQCNQSKLESCSMCGETCIAADSNQNDATSSSQVWQTDAKTNASVVRPAATVSGVT